MKVEDIFNDLIFGELSAHAIAMEGVVQDKDKPKLIAHLNVALTALYTRFPLLTKQLVVIQKSYITEYKLTTDHAMSNSDSTAVKYIYDSLGDPFTGDLLRIDAVYDEIGDELLLNSSEVCKVAATPAQNILEVPNPTDTNALFVIYRARHPVVTLTTTDIELSEQLRPALLAYVASRVYAGGTAVEHATISATLMQKFELFCMQLEEYGMVNKNYTNLNMKPCLGGWV